MNADLTTRTIDALDAAIEYTAELLAIHDRDKGRTTPKNRYIAETLEADLEQMVKLQDELQAELKATQSTP